MKKIRITGIEGYYYVEEDTLIYTCDDIDGYVEVSDLADLTIYQYNELAKNIWVHYPSFDMEKLEGRFI
tara:strand:- start:404 stop:610 length:207 start_codon:yes stop_codon:yes gene_type:complete